MKKKKFIQNFRSTIHVHNGNNNKKYLRSFIKKITFHDQVKDVALEIYVQKI